MDDVSVGERLMKWSKKHTILRKKTPTTLVFETVRNTLETHNKTDKERTPGKGSLSVKGVCT